MAIIECLEDQNWHHQSLDYVQCSDNGIDIDSDADASVWPPSVRSITRMTCSSKKNKPIVNVKKNFVLCVMLCNCIISAVGCMIFIYWLVFDAYPIVDED